VLIPSVLLALLLARRNCAATALQRTS
jgi:hypothetical protein